MKKVAKFSKVSFEQFVEDCKGILGDVYIENKMEYLSEKYKNINIPKRSTACSAGHDISTPFNIRIKVLQFQLVLGAKWIEIT